MAIVAAAGTVTEWRFALLNLIKEHAFIVGGRNGFILASGKSSNYYIDGKQITLDPEGIVLVSRIILSMLEQEEVDAIGGLTIGADPVAAAVAALSYVEGRQPPIHAFVVRKEPKSHGTRKWIEGPQLKSGARVVIVDDVITTGKSIIQAIERVTEDVAAQIVKVIVVVDRLEGGQEKLAEMGYKLEPILTASDLGVV